MALPAPNLDDRRFQDLVDDAKRLLQQRCKGWTDHNVSDPGVTLIELFAWMTDQILYRMNRVPERTFLTFLDLIGVELFPPTPAKADITFWLSAPQEKTIRVPAKSEVATVRTQADEAIVFSTVVDLDIPPCTLAQAGSMPADGKYADLGDALSLGTATACFGDPPSPGDSLLIGLSDAVPSCAVLIRFDCETQGLGIDPRDPPLIWEAWDGSDWKVCEVSRDTTQGLNVPGDVIIHVPPSHETSLISKRRAGWLRCRVVEARRDQPAYTASPRIRRLSASTIGGTVEAVHAEIIDGEILGFSEGIAGQRFTLKRTPVTTSDDPPVVEVAEGDGWQEWTLASTFADSGPDERHYNLDYVTGEVRLGPAVRAPDGSMVQYGAVPSKGAAIRMRSYRSGGGRRGNVAAGAISVLKSSIPFVTRVENRGPARGGVDVEDLEDAKTRGAIVLRTANRAVTAEDYEQLAWEAAPEAARVRCVTANGDGDAGAVRVLVVPAAPDDDGRIAFEHLVPDDETLANVAQYLDERRVVGARLVVEYPDYQGITVVARLRPRPNASPKRLKTAALEALYRFFNPLIGGPDGQGWPFGRPVHIGDVYAALQRVQGVELVEEAALFAANPRTGARGEPTQRIDLGPNDLAFSYDHQVVVEELT